MTRAIITLILATAIGGCALTPDELRQEGTRFELTLKLAPVPASRCIARNAEKISSLLVATERDLEGTKAREVIIRQHYQSARTVLVAHLHPSGSGSQAEIWVVSNDPDFAREVTAAC